MLKSMRLTPSLNTFQRKKSPLSTHNCAGDNELSVKYFSLEVQVSILCSQTLPLGVARTFHMEKRNESNSPSDIAANN